MKAEYLNCVIEGVLGVIKQCFNVECTRGKPYIIPSDTNISHLSAVIKVSGDHNGAFAISLSEDDAKKMASKLIMEEKRFLDKDVMDAIGEVINMISGGAKGQLSKLGVTFQLSTPIFILGKGTRLFTDTEYAPYIGVPFATSIGSFTVQVSLK